MRCFLVFLFSTLAMAIADKPLVQSGPVSGPIHPAVGDIVATKRGPASISLEGFSEDDNQDGYVDPVVQEAPVIPYAKPLPYYPAPHFPIPAVRRIPLIPLPRPYGIPHPIIY